jgi:phage terminase large subunit-like protein
MPSLAERAALRLAAIRRARADDTLKVVKPFCPNPPYPKQRTFLELDAQEALFGGAAGGGKTESLIMSALQYVDHPRYSAILMRRREVDLTKKNAILDRAREWFTGTAAKWDAKLGGFRFPSGATICFGHLTHLADREKWKGPEFQFVGIEELTDWSEEDYVFMFSRMRSVDAAVPTRMRANTNPGGVGHEWVFNRFVRFARQLGTGVGYEDWRKGDRVGLACFESPPSAQVVAMARSLSVRAQGAHFVPAFAEDNPSLNRNEYLMNLAQLDPVEFAWYGEGDWNATPSGEIFERGWLANYLDVEPPDAQWCRYWDLAGTDPNAPDAKSKDPAFSAGVKVGLQWMRSGAARVVISNVVRDRKKPADVELMVAATAECDGSEVDVVFEQEPGSAGIAVVNGYQLRTLLGFSVHADRKTGSKEEMWRPLAGLARAGGLWLVRGEWNDAFVKELVGLPAGKKDQADAAAGGYAWLLARRKAPAVDVGDAVLEDARESPWN